MIPNTQLLLLLISGFLGSTLAQTPSVDCPTVIKAYQAMGRTWTFGSNCCGVNGVICVSGRVTEIIWDNRGLSGAIPDYLFNLQNLAILDLSSNRCFLPNTSATINSNLKNLDLSNNNISSLAGIEKLTGLVRLYAGSNLITSLPSNMTLLRNLRYLDLPYNNISNISVIRALTGLTQLRLSNNNISSLAGIEELTGLWSLTASNNRITSLPSNLIQLGNLRNLYLSNNKISSLAGIEKLTGLVTLYAGSNLITSLPSNMTLLRNLSSLYLSYNNISSLAGIEKLTGLWNLYASNNRITSLPSNMIQLGNLGYLDLSNNNISSLAGIEKLTGLVILTASNNRITSLPSNMIQLGNLRRLYLSYNNISSLTGIEQLANLQYFYVQGNRITTIPANTPKSVVLVNCFPNPIADFMRIPDHVRRAIPAATIPSALLQNTLMSVANSRSILKRQQLSTATSSDEMYCSKNMLDMTKPENNNLVLGCLAYMITQCTSSSATRDICFNTFDRNYNAVGLGPVPKSCSPWHSHLTTGSAYPTQTCSNSVTSVAANLQPFASLSRDFIFHPYSDFYKVVFSKFYQVA